MQLALFIQLIISLNKVRWGGKKQPILCLMTKNGCILVVLQTLINLKRKVRYYLH